MSYYFVELQDFFKKIDEHNVVLVDEKSFYITSDAKIHINGVETNIAQIEQKENIVYIKSGVIRSPFGKYQIYELNTAVYQFYIDTSSTNGDILFGSSVSYGYEVDNSSMEVVTQPLLNRSFYKKLRERFDIAYGEEMICEILPVFIQYLFEECDPSGYKELFEKLDNFFDQVAPLKKMCNPLDSVQFEKKYNWLIVRNTATGQTFLDKFLISQLIHKSQYLTYIHESGQLCLENYPNIDVYIVITKDEEACFEVPTSSYCIVCPDVFYQSSRRLMRSFPKVLAWATQNNVNDRTVSLTKPGACSGPKEDGGCCGGSSGEKGGCCGGEEKEESCCKKEEEKMECCGGNSDEKGGCCNESDAETFKIISTTKYYTASVKTTGGCKKGPSCCQTK